MLARRALQFGMVALALAMTAGLLSSLEIGFDLEPVDPEASVEERLVDGFENSREEYLAWGRWVDLATMGVFGSVLIAAPFIVGSRRARHLLVAGAATAVVGDLIDLSQLVGFEIGQFSLDNGLAADFAAGNAFSFAINTTSTYVWVGGLVVLSIGALILAVDSPTRSYAKVTAMLGVALLAMAATDLWASAGLFEVASWIGALIAAYWLWASLAMVETPPQS